MVELERKSDELENLQNLEHKLWQQVRFSYKMELKRTDR